MCTALVLERAKKTDVTFFIAGHVTKDGDLAGPKNLEHMVDTVLYFEGDKMSETRFLKVIKNRFGATGEMGIFKMEGKGLVPVKDYSLYFINSLSTAKGKIIYPHLEGNKVIFTEVQALTAYTSFGYPKRTANGVDLNRLNLLLSVIGKYLGINLSVLDVYINVVGGLEVKDRALDLAICIAIYLSAKKIEVEANYMVFGEVSLHGEVLRAGNVAKRMKSIEKIAGNFKVISHDKEIGKQNKNMISVSNLADIKEILK
jgi:DNA repair protein RadA/Sms